VLGWKYIVSGRVVGGEVRAMRAWKSLGMTDAGPRPAAARSGAVGESGDLSLGSYLVVRATEMPSEVAARPRSESPVTTTSSLSAAVAAAARWTAS